VEFDLLDRSLVLGFHRHKRSEAMQAAREGGEEETFWTHLIFLALWLCFGYPGLCGSEVTADAMRRDVVLTYRWHHSAIHLGARVGDPLGGGASSANRMRNEDLIPRVDTGDDCVRPGLEGLGVVRSADSNVTIEGVTSRSRV
jgi:hypothetical protein